MSEKRQHIRRPVRYPGRIEFDDGAPAHPCSLHDVSEQGAQLVLPAPHELPAEFTLVLGYDGTARRRCWVAWRSGNQVGVKFVTDPANA
jgi:hypothetical protein